MTTLGLSSTLHSESKTVLDFPPEKFHLYIDSIRETLKTLENGVHMDGMIEFFKGSDGNMKGMLRDYTKEDIMILQNRENKEIDSQEQRPALPGESQTASLLGVDDTRQIPLTFEERMGIKTRFFIEENTEILGKRREFKDNGYGNGGRIEHIYETLAEIKAVIYDPSIAVSPVLYLADRIDAASHQLNFLKKVACGFNQFADDPYQAEEEPVDLVWEEEVKSANNH